MFGRRKPDRSKAFFIGPGDSLPPEALHAFDQQQARVRDFYDEHVAKLVEIAQSCECGQPVNGPIHTIGFQAQLARADAHTLAALALEGMLRDALAAAGQSTPESTS